MVCYSKLECQNMDDWDVNYTKQKTDISLSKLDLRAYGQFTLPKTQMSNIRLRKLVVSDGICQK